MDTKEGSITFARETSDIIRLNNWIFSHIQIYIKGRTLELGSGNGAFAAMFFERGLPLHLSDELLGNREYLLKRFQGITTMKMIHEIDFHDISSTQTYADMAGVFSTVIAINITEHGIYDKLTLLSAKHFLRIRGHFIAVIPSNAVLFNNMASSLEDLKEYNLRIARNLMGESFEILKVRYFEWSPGPKSLAFDQPGLYTLAIFRKRQT